MLPDYGVVVGRYVDFTTKQGQWLHVDLNIAASDAEYQAAVDVNEPNGLFQYQVFNDLDVSQFSPIPALPEKAHPVVPGSPICGMRMPSAAGARGHLAGCGKSRHF